MAGASPGETAGLRIISVIGFMAISSAVHSNNDFGEQGWGVGGTAGPGLTLLLLPAQHSCGMQERNSPGEHPSPDPRPAPASAPGGDTAQKPGPQKPGPQNPPAAYAGEGSCSSGACSWHRDGNFGVAFV